MVALLLTAYLSEQMLRRYKGLFRRRKLEAFENGDYGVSGSLSLEELREGCLEEGRVIRAEGGLERVRWLVVMVFGSATGFGWRWRRRWRYRWGWGEDGDKFGNSFRARRSSKVGRGD